MFDTFFDFLVSGSGGRTVTRAIAANQQGLNALFLEKTDDAGGPATGSGGAVWIPNNHLLHKGGSTEDREEALRYLNAAIGRETAATGMGCTWETASARRGEVHQGLLVASPWVGLHYTDEYCSKAHSE